MNILVLTAGSATLKFRLLDLRDEKDDGPRVTVDGLVDKWGMPKAGLKLTVAGTSRGEIRWSPTRRSTPPSMPSASAEHMGSMRLVTV